MCIGDYGTDVTSLPHSSYDSPLVPALKCARFTHTTIVVARRWGWPADTKRLGKTVPISSEPPALSLFCCYTSKRSATSVTEQYSSSCKLKEASREEAASGSFHRNSEGGHALEWKRWRSLQRMTANLVRPDVTVTTDLPPHTD